ncbi:MAG TPA: VOC family protein [Saprospiraceae bacterium]|nr:VOC family protein [Saprospiraceae bacterium]
MEITGTNLTIMVKNMDQAIGFYESIGFKLQNRWDNHYAMVTTTGITVGLHPSESEVNSSGTVSLGMMIKDIEEVKELLNAKNIVYKQDDGKSGVYLHFTDPDGTILYFVLPKW